MGRRGRISIWTALGTVAGVVGAGAAVYSVFSTNQHDALVTFPNYLDQPEFVWVEALSNTVVLTGNWFLKSGNWWNARTLSAGDVVGLGNLTGLRIAANERRVVPIDDSALKSWLGGRLERCHPGEIEMGVEYISKSGVSWARTKLPFCARETVNPPRASGSPAS